MDNPFEYKTPTEDTYSLVGSVKRGVKRSVNAVRNVGAVGNFLLGRKSGAKLMRKAGARVAGSVAEKQAVKKLMEAGLDKETAYKFAGTGRGMLKGAWLDAKPQSMLGNVREKTIDKVEGGLNKQRGKFFNPAKAYDKVDAKASAAFQSAVDRPVNAIKDSIGKTNTSLGKKTFASRNPFVAAPVNTSKTNTTPAQNPDFTKRMFGGFKPNNSALNKKPDMSGYKNPAIQIAENARKSASKPFHKATKGIFKPIDSGNLYRNHGLKSAARAGVKTAGAIGSAVTYPVRAVGSAAVSGTKSLVNKQVAALKSARENKGSQGVAPVNRLSTGSAPINTTKTAQKDDE